MTEFLHYMVLMGLFWSSPGAFRLLSHDLDDSCTEDEYLHGKICCLNCPAGYHMTSPCTSAGQRGKCEECVDGTYTEFSNGLQHCFKCTQCRSDQSVLRPCTMKQNTECECKSGRYCAPDQACEVCKTCSRCQKDEKIMRNCNSTANTECKKTQLSPGFSSGKTAAIVFTMLLAAGLLTVFVMLVRRWRTRGSLRNVSVMLKDGQHCSDSSLTEERGDTDTPRSSCTGLILPGQLADKEFPRLVPMNGEESLRKCFEYFEEIDVDYHKRFFRHLGLADNVIKSKEHLHYEDKIHELLSVWIEKEGREGNLNHLLTALLVSNQRRTAEQIKEKAVHNGHYLYEY
ncbi:tumor necrosis factor receptor superfamily member 10B-like [Notolabrus celidotus]|uniref:tumor necrosis factor receptor superfamily member 10B-like n=1 Tax=Notolabrus celidotus TaxID=1203425 RepID=UPI0014908142|nr:tumor necrosis factor receptor superfamily member 10B-like [Notolabrus celidotus]